MNWLEKKILVSQFKQVIKSLQGGPMNFWKQYGPIILTLAATAGAAIFTPQFISTHPVAFAIAAIVAQILHSVLPSVFTSAPSPNINSIRAIILVLAAALCLAVSAHAQTTPPATGPLNLYGAGVSYNNSGVPAIAGTAMYAHLVNDGSGTYVFTVVDALPNSLKPFTVTTDIGAGIAQKVFSIGSVPVFIPTSAGISFSGPNTGWAWTTGAMASIKVKGQFRILPNVRIAKSSVANGTGYLPIIGILFAFGK